MAQVREIKSRIANIKNIKQITKAMNAIAMAKVTRLKKQLNRSRPYQEVINSKLELLSGRGLQDESREEETISPILEQGDGDTIGLAVFNSDRGLSGNYTVDINRSARDFVRSRDSEVKLFAGGDKAHQFFRKWDQLETSWVGFYQEPDFETAEAMGKELLDSFLEGIIGELWVVYMEFFSDLKQKLKVEKILPLSPEEAVEESSADEEEYTGPEGEKDYIFDPNEEEIVTSFLEEWFMERIFWIVLNTKASEHAIRRKAMRDATDNANELIDDLTLTYNKARQQEITREIADIIGGAEALREE
ncbi:MAG: ATP synthase F1 subunit gamma [Candidatus Bipolaricaulota bacterium]|nr:ATP synthase F1 subunit gamma [Candidatus Bipolaricaulota bacterium]MBS3792415.1 ATP synthase F1 subunit gamma [Candidatus Bipolaricaulota bacterium]